MAKPSDAVRRLSAATLVALAISVPAHANLWDIRPSVFVGATYSDNLGIRADRRAGGVIYEARPELVVERDGPQFDLALNYRMQAFSGQEDRRRNNANNFHFLNANADYQIVADMIGVAMQASISQQNGDPDIPPGFSIGNPGGGLNEVQTLAFEPYYNFQLGPFTTGRLSYRRGLLDYEESFFPDSDEGRASLTLTSNPPSAPWNWTVLVQDTQIEFDNDIEFTLQRASVDIGIQVTPRMDMVVNVGVDENDLGALPSANQTDGSFWLAGLRGSIGAFTTYEVRAGEQFFGDSYLLRFDRVNRRFTTSISYSEDTTTLTGQQLGFEDLLNFLSEVGGLELPAVNQDLFVRKRGVASIAYSLAKSTFEFTAFNEDREYITFFNGLGADGARGVTASWGWQPSGRTSITTRAAWQKSELRDQNVTPEDIRMDFQIRRTIARDYFASATVFHSQRTSARDVDEFEENGIAIGIGYTF